MKRFTYICGLPCLLVLFAVSCANQNATVTHLRLRGTGVAEAAEVGGIAALLPERRRVAAVPQAAKIRVTGDLAMDSDAGICLLVTLKNEGDIQLAVGLREEFDELSLLVDRRMEDVIPHYVRVEPRLVEPRWPGGSHWSQVIEPSKTMSWKVPLANYYDLEPGAYRALVTIRFSVGFGPEMFPTSVTAGPLEFVKSAINNTEIKRGRTE